jgi:CRP/FNR family transcriptional regulator, nitrogen oxide reductase regulator
MTAPARRQGPPRAVAGQPDPAALRDLPFFAGLDAAAVAEVVRAGQARRLPEGATLFEQGAEARGVYLLLQGRLKAVQTGADGQQVIVRFLGPGEPAGVLGMLGPGQRYPASAVAVVDSVVLSWEGMALQELVRRHPGIALNTMRAMGGRMQEVHARLGEMAGERVERRLAHALLRLVRQAGRREEDGAVRIDFPVSRQDVAEMAGTTLHTASRVLSGWEQAGVLGTGGRRRIVVRDPHALVRIAEG